MVLGAFFWKHCETSSTEFKQRVTFISSLHSVSACLQAGVAWRQIRLLALLNTTDNKRAFCIDEKSPIIYWLSLTLCLSDLRLPLIPITGNTVPLSRETISHLSAQQENMRKHLPGPEELITLWWKSAPPPSASLLLPSPPPPHPLASALPLCQSSLWPLGRRGGNSGVEATEQQSESDHQGISQKLCFASSTGGRVSTCCSLGMCVGCTGGS